MPQPAQRGVLGASVDVLTGCFAAASADVVASAPLVSVPAASAVSSSPKSFPRAGGSRDGHCPCYAKNISFKALNSSVDDDMISSDDSAPSAQFTAPAMVVMTTRTPFFEVSLRQLLKTRGIYNV